MIPIFIDAPAQKRVTILKLITFAKIINLFYLTLTQILPLIMRTILLLLVSNTFMTFAWYGHLKRPDLPIWKAILISWGIAFFEYLFMVPANKLGYGQFNAFQLKTIQEAITLVVFVVFAVFYLKEPLKWNYLLGFFLVFLAVWVVFRK
ncbi:DMT family protein [Emticicia oligotrophica]|uniref:DMT family protein n=1 Tax=Emticicia TaxID=312278 RepID=UPI0002FA52CB